MSARRLTASALLAGLLLSGVAAAPAQAVLDGGPTIHVDGLSEGQELPFGAGAGATVTCTALSAPVELCDVRLDTRPYVNGTPLDAQYNDHMLTVLARDTEGRESQLVVHYRVVIGSSAAKAETTKLKASVSRKVATVRIVEKSKRTPSGIVTVSITKGGKNVRTVTATVTRNRLKVRMPKLKSGKYVVTAVYHGDQYLGSSTVKKKLRVG